MISKDLPALRKTLKMATGVLYCEHCPRYYFSIVQNAMVLTTLCLCLAKFYNRMVDTIEEEAKRASKNNELKRLTVSGLDAASQGAIRSPKTGGLEQHPYFVEMAAFDWRDTMRKIVKAEVYGVEGHREMCFMTLLQRLEERQRSWHQTPPSPDCPPSYRSACHVDGQKPTCLVMLEDVRHVISQIGFQ